MHRSNMRGIICAKTGLGKAHYIDSFAGMMSSLRKIAGKTNIPSSPRDKSIHRPKTADRFRKNLRYGSILKGCAKKSAFERMRIFLSKPQAWHIIAARSAVHIISPFGAVSHHAPACIFLRLDDIQHFVLMIYRNKLRMKYKATP